MDAAEWADVMGHQLKGIMFHADAAAYCWLKGWRTLAAEHERQTLEETACHLQASKRAISELGKVLTIPQQTRLIIPVDATKQALLEMWLKWERETAALYNVESCAFLQTLYKKVCREIKTVERWLDK